MTEPCLGICGDDIVISGIACRLPESDNVGEFAQHLFNGDDMVTEDDRRWPPGRFATVIVLIKSLCNVSDYITRHFCEMIFTERQHYQFVLLCLFLLFCVIWCTSSLHLNYM